MCGQATYSDIKTLLMLTNPWNPKVQNNIATVVAQCTSCRASAGPLPNRYISLASLNALFKYLVYINHMNIGKAKLWHAMDAKKHFLAAIAVQSTSLDEVIFSFEFCWLAPFVLQHPSIRTVRFKGRSSITSHPYMVQKFWLVPHDDN